MSKCEVLSRFSIEKETAHRIQANIVNSSKTMSYIFMILIIFAFEQCAVGLSVILRFPLRAKSTDYKL